MLEFRTILRIRQEPGVVWRALVDCGTENILLKFSIEPVEADVRAVIDPVINRINAERTVREAGISLF